MSEPTRSEAMEELTATVRALEAQVTEAREALGPIKERLLDAFPEDDVPAVGRRFRGSAPEWNRDSVRSLAEHVAAIVRQKAEENAALQSRIAEADALGSKMQAKAAEALARVAELTRERDEARDEVERVDRLYDEVAEALDAAGVPVREDGTEQAGRVQELAARALPANPVPIFVGPLFEVMEKVARAAARVGGAHEREQSARIVERVGFRNLASIIRAGPVLDVLDRVPTPEAVPPDGAKKPDQTRE